MYRSFTDACAMCIQKIRSSFKNHKNWRNAQRHFLRRKPPFFSGALDEEHVWNLDGALTVADRLAEYMLVNNMSSDSELGVYLVNKGITPFPDRLKPYINYAHMGAEYREKHGGAYFSGNYVQKKTPELLENETLDGAFRIWMAPLALFVYRAKQRR